jgi:hypothetical protein
MQTKRQSVVEAVIGTAFAFITGVAVGQWIVYPAFGLHPSLFTNIHMTVWFTAISMVRSYYTRRVFNWLNNRRR